MNIVNTISNAIGGDAYEKLSGLIGEDADKTRSAASAAIPALLAGIAHLGSTRDGAAKVTSAVDQADEHLASRMSSLGSADAHSLIDRGRELLGSLFGSGSLAGLGGALGKFTGIGSGSMLGFLGGLAPLLLGSLKKIKTSMGLDAAGFSNLLSSQKESIARSMPAGLSGMLANVPELSEMTGAAREYAGAAAGATSEAGRATMRAAADTGRAVADAGRAAAPAGGSFLRWAIPIAVLLCLAVWLIPKFANRGAAGTNDNASPQVANPSAVPADARTAAARIGSSVGDVSDQVKGWSTSVIDALTNIKDAASAEAALPSLRELSGKLDGVTTSLDAMPDEARKPIVQTLSSTFTKVKELADKAMAIPGAGEKLRPVVEPMLRKLRTLSGA